MLAVLFFENCDTSGTTEKLETSTSGRRTFSLFQLKTQLTVSLSVASTSKRVVYVLRVVSKRRFRAKPVVLSESPPVVLPAVGIGSRTICWMIGLIVPGMFEKPCACANVRMLLTVQMLPTAPDGQ